MRISDWSSDVCSSDLHAQADRPTFCARADSEKIVMRSVVIEPGSTEQQYWRDLWRYRELFLVLAWRDVAVRYKQTLIGLAWALLQPLLIMVSFTVIFGRVAKMPSEGSAPYALLVLSGLLAWQLFSPK